MATQAANQLYPLSTEDGKHIPLDVIRPLGVFLLAVPTEGVAFTLPSQYDMVSVLSTVNAVWTFNSEVIALGEDIPNAVMLHKDAILTVILPSITSCFIAPLEAEEGNVYIQAIQRWAGIGLQRQIARR